MLPINYKFVTYQEIKDSDGKPITVLSLDTEANSQYWKVIYSFPEFLKAQKLDRPDQVKSWHISTRFASSEPFVDLIHDLNPNAYHSEDVELKIYDIPVSYVEDDRPFCVLEMADGTLVENELWK